MIICKEYNSIMAGILISWYYHHSNLLLFDSGTILTMFAAAMAINLAVMHFLDYQKSVHSVVCVFASLVLLYSAYQGGFLGLVQWNMVGIVAIMILSFNMACLRFPGIDGEHEYLEIAKMSSMLTMGLISYCVLVALTEGESLDAIGEMVDWPKKSR